MSLKIEKISKSFITKDEKIDVLKDLCYEFEKGKFYAIVGHSGSGKTTLLKVLGLLTSFDSGNYYIDNIDVKKMTEKEISLLRMKKIGFIFQDYFLDPYLKAYENILIALILNKSIKAEERKNVAMQLLTKVDMQNRKNHFPKELSGGEQQRISIARALANDPDYILADEPTGNLDIKNEEIIFQTLKDLSQSGKCVIVVSHSKDILSYADIVLNIETGNIEVQK